MRWGVLAAVLLGLALPAGLSAETFDARWQRDTDRRPIPMPEPDEVGPWWDFFYQNIFRQGYRLLDFGHHAQHIGRLWGGDSLEAVNVNAWGEVPDSSWFTNRLGRHRLTVTDVVRGARTRPGPVTTAPWRVVRGKSAGVTPGFVIEDARGDTYFIKFGFPGADVLTTTAELVSSLLTHALGYNTPANYLVNVPRSIFHLDEDATTKDAYGETRALTLADLRRLLGNTNLRPDGTVRVVASRALPGEFLGTWSYEGRRSDDPNDRIPHEDRRELRGYRLFAAWLNSSDTQAKNTFAAYVGESGEGYVRRYMIDFGTTLGSGGDGMMAAARGFESDIDWGAMARYTFTLGFQEPVWYANTPSTYPEIGRFNAEPFDPERWTPTLPNPAFERMTDRDGFWAAKKLAHFRDRLIDAAVAAGKIGNPAATRELARVLKARRDKILELWFERITPLDHPQLARQDDGTYRLAAVDLAVDAQLASAQARRYKVTVEPRRGDALTPRHVDDLTEGVPVAFPGSGERRFEIQVDFFEGGERIGDGTVVDVFCPAAGRCRIVGLKR